jgi:hypothetical protein
MWLKGDLGPVGKMRNVYAVLIRTSKEKRPVWRPREDSTLLDTVLISYQMGLKEICRVGVVRIALAQDGIR